MRKLVLFLECGVGTKTAEAYLVPDDVTQKELDDFSWQRACEHADMYGIYPRSDQPEDFDEEEDKGDSYSDDIEGWWEEYTEEHDGELIFGNNSSFTWNEF